MGVGVDLGRGVLPGRVSWCVQHTIGDSGRWGSTCNYQGVLPGLFAGQETTEFEEVVVYQCGVSHKVATIHAWVEVIINTGNDKNMYNALDGDSLHVL